MAADSNMKDQWVMLLQGNQEAMVSVYETLYVDLLSYGTQLVNDRENVKDAINDIFLTIWDNRSRLNPVANVKAYLFTCLRRKIFQSTSRVKKLQALPAEALLFGQYDDVSYEEILMMVQHTEEQRIKVQSALLKLTERQRELIRLKYFDGLDYNQIETTTGISTKTAYNTVYNAMKILTQELKNTFIFIIAILFTR